MAACDGWKACCWLVILNVFFSMKLTNSIGPPVILVPGDGGSQVMAKLDKPEVVHFLCTKKTDNYFNLWLTLSELTPEVIDCFVDNMRLVYNNSTHTTSNSPGVDTKIPGFGNTSSVEWLDPYKLAHFSSTSYYNHIVDALVKKGYVRGMSVRGAPYDFRKAPNELDDFFRKVKVLIEDTYKKNNNTRVVLLAHSMGNPNMLYFLHHQSQQWKDKYIRYFISLSGVWGGSVKPLRLMASGDSLGIPLVKALSVRREQRTMPSTAYLMPSARFWKPNEVLVSRPSKNYTVKDYQEFFEDLGYPTGYLMRKDTQNLVNGLIPPGVEVYCIHGYGIKTPGTLVYKDGMWPDSQPDLVYDDGDGTVNIRSLLGCLAWQGKQKYTVHHKIFSKVEHTAILANTMVINYVLSVIGS